MFNSKKNKIEILTYKDKKIMVTLEDLRDNYVETLHHNYLRKDKKYTVHRLNPKKGKTNSIRMRLTGQQIADSDKRFLADWERLNNPEAIKKREAIVNETYGGYDNVSIHDLEFKGKKRVINRLER